MSLILFANDAQSTLAGSITNVATVANLAPGTGALFPAPGAGQYFTGTFIDAATGLVKEIVRVTDVTGDQITMVRAQEGTSAQAWTAGDIFANQWTAGQAAAMQQQGQPVTAAAREITSSALTTLLLTDYFVGLNRTVSPVAQIINLPNGAAVGQSFVIQDLANNFASAKVTVVPPAGTIAGRNNVVLNENGQSATFTYYGSNLWGVAT